MPIFGGNWVTLGAYANTQTTTTTAMSSSLWAFSTGTATTTTMIPVTTVLPTGILAAMLNAHTQVWPPPTMSPEGIDDINRMRAAMVVHAAAVERAAERSGRNEAARERARELLLSFLSPEQKTEFAASQSFIVAGKSGCRYRVRYGRVGNIDVLGDADAVAYRLCVHPSDGTIPVEDVMLAQMLHLRDDDIGTRRIANVHGR